MNQNKLLQIIEKAAEEKITFLNLSKKRIKSLPAELGKLTNLTKLWLYDNRLTSIPPELGKLTKLTELYLFGNKLTSIPSELGKLTNLTTLLLQNNKLTSIQVELGKLTNLTRLDLDSNQLTSIPTELGKLVKLTRLSLSSNQLKSIPPELGKLTKLMELYLFGNKLTNIPAELGELTNLTALDLSNNQLTSIPAELGQLTSLTTLSLFDNQLKNIPFELGQLTNLTTLYLHSNQLTGIPAKLGQLTNLTGLDLSGNQLTRIPKALGKLTNLECLALENNKLREIPSEIGALISLRALDLARNKIGKLPQEIGQLINLIEMNLGPIGLELFPAEFMGSKRAEDKAEYAVRCALDILGPGIGNKLTSLPLEVGKLVKLNKLSLDCNELRTIPKEVGQLRKVRELKLAYNRLKALPSELGQLTNLQTLDLDGNENLKSPPPEVVEQGTKAILAYLRELAKGKKKRYEAKLLLLGDGSEGKTCVSRALRNLEFKEQIRTEGVEVAQWTFANPQFPGDKQKEIKLNIWDFEGQEINHQSHQFFLTSGGLYLLVINGRRQFKMDRAEYWLDTIRSRAPGSRVILIASECENTTPSWPLDKLKAGYGDLLRGQKWFFAVGCESKKGIGNLAVEIKSAAADIDVMGMDWPVNYERSEEGIRKRAKADAQVSRAELYTIFKDCGISKESFGNVSEQMATLGMITQFRESPELEDFVVLNPQWLTKAISQVMEDEQLEEDKGEITHNRMRAIWDKEYQGLYPTFHSCMKEFELCYDMEDVEGCLLPLRFGSTRPEIPWSNIPGTKERRVEYRLSMRPPKGIMSRFIVKTHYMIAKTKEMPKGVYWKNGVFLRTGDGEYTSEALCEFDESERVMSIRVRAAFPQNMIEQLHGFAKAVFGFFEGLKTERRYGCMKFEEAREHECEGAHAERRILFALSRSKEIDCDRGWHVVDPMKLVFGFSSFGEDALTLEELQEELAKKPKWAEDLIGDIKSSLVWIDKIYDEVFSIRERQEELAPDVAQRVALKLRDYLDMIEVLLDNRDFNSAPAVVSIVPVDGSVFNPKNWFEKEYLLTPYCEYKGGVHKADFSITFRKPKSWWQKTAPKLAVGVKVLSAGIKIACAGLPLAVDPKLFDAMKNEVEFMKELAGHLELEGVAESDISSKAGEAVDQLKGKGKVRDFRKLGGEDDKRIVRMQLAELFAEIAPKNYKARQWRELRRLRMADNTYRWLCDKHAAEYKK